MKVLQPGEIFDRQYLLVELLDTGGFADVWKARHISANNHIVALKVYPMLDMEGVKSIELEYDVQKDLSHSNIATAKHFGKDENGYPYIVMKFCNLGNASRRAGKFDEREIAKAIKQLSSALSYLHGHENIVHQDVKPNNILIDEKDGRETYYLADLGLSLRVRNTIKRSAGATNSNENSYQTGLTPPPYRAPELWGKDNLHKMPVKATDIWAFGATLYELITGEVPLGEFGGLNQVNDNSSPDLPAEYGMSAELNELIKKCLEKEPWDRPKASDLQAWAENYLNEGFWFPRQSARSVGDSGTVRDGVPVTPFKKSKSNVNKWLVAGLVLFLSGVGAYFSFKSPGAQQEKDTSTTFSDPDTSRAEDSVVIPREPENKKKPETRSETAQNSGSAIDEPIPKEVEAEPERIMPVRLVYPQVRRKPQGSCIDIREITRSQNEISVTFELCNDTPETVGYAIYDSGDYAFVLKDENKTYKVRSISPSGSGSLKPSEKIRIRALFEGVPHHIDQVNILEGENQLAREDRRRWNFIGVSLPALQ